MSNLFLLERLDIWLSVLVLLPLCLTKHFTEPCLPAVSFSNQLLSSLNLTLITFSGLSALKSASSCIFFFDNKYTVCQFHCQCRRPIFALDRQLQLQGDTVSVRGQNNTRYHCTERADNESKWVRSTKRSLSHRRSAPTTSGHAEGIERFSARLRIFFLSSLRIPHGQKIAPRFGII